MPDWKSVVEERLASLRLQAPAELDLTAELAEHLEDYYRELRSGGTSEEEAYQRTLSELDDIYPLRAEAERSNRMAKHDAVPTGDIRPGNLMEDLWRDLRYGARAIRTSPLFALAAVLCLGVGIGANTAVFTIINTLLLHPLP
ncbi:MAG TPA: permease prefix domain 1-containing protein, partial [Terriglobia bacterium]|nr:permease prefix domain 1-containing protein [Terriglobia bacterium]